MRPIEWQEWFCFVCHMCNTVLYDIAPYYYRNRNCRHYYYSSEIYKNSALQSIVCSWAAPNFWHGILNYNYTIDVYVTYNATYRAIYIICEVVMQNHPDPY